MHIGQNNAKAANPPLRSSDEVNADSVHPTAEDDSHLLSPLNSNGKELEQSSYQEFSKRYGTTRRKSWLRTWWKEILSIVLIISCLAANTGWLGAINSKPYETWHVAGVNITPNAMISIFTTIAKASLLFPVAESVVQLKWLYFQARIQRVSDSQIFDDASRGPLGSLVLLGRIHLRSSLASIGAIVILLTLGGRAFQSAGRKTNIFDRLIDADVDKQAVTMTAYLQQLSVAANSGISKPAGDVLYGCPSGSCSWPPFSSLALCNYCMDIANYTDVSCSTPSKMSSDHRLCTYSLSPDLSSRVFTNGAPLLAWNLWSKDYTYGFDIGTVLLKLAIVRFSESYNSTSPNAPDDIMPSVDRCEMSWCAQYHGASLVRDGKLYDEPIFSVIVTGSDGDYVPDASKIPKDYATEFNDTIEPFQIDSDFSEITQSLLASIVQSRVFDPSRALMNDIDLFQQSPSSYSSEYYTALVGDFSSSSTNVSVNPSTARANAGRTYSLYYANNGNVRKTLKDVANSLTAQLRSGVGSTNVTGVVTYPINYIRVVWPWFIYPASLALMAAALLIATICVSTGRDKIIWKSSSLALLFHGLPEEEADGKLLDSEHMEATADGMWARLSHAEDGSVRLKML